MINGTAVKRPGFTWDVTFTGSYNKNEVLKLADGLDRIQMDVAVNSYAFIFAEVGKPYSTIKGYRVKKNAEGATMYNKANGFELTTGLEDLGTGVSPWSGGINNSFSYKRFNLSFLIDGKFGGHVYSGTNLYATRFGLHKITLPGREGGLTVTGVDGENKPFSKTFTYGNDLQAYYDNYKFQSERFIYSSDFIKLRQVILGYSLPANLFSFAKFQSVSLSLVGRNLLILHKKAPNIDPESTFNNSNAQGFEMFGVPRTRSFGLNLMVKL